MSGPNGAPKPSDTVSFTNVENPVQSNGQFQTGGWDDVGVAPNPPYSGTPSLSVLEGIPAQTRVTISGSGVTRVGAPNQFRLNASLSDGTVQLIGHVTDATNFNTDPPLGMFVWISRNTKVATVNSSGLITPIGRGECDIECRYSRAANLPFANASPSPTESMAVYATVNLTVTA